MDHPPNSLPRSVRWFAPWTWDRRAMVAAAIPVVLVAYVMSIGPAIWLAQHTVVSDKLVERAYRPVLYVEYRLDDHTRSLANAYLRWWHGSWLSFVEIRHMEWEADAEYIHFHIEPEP